MSHVSEIDYNFGAIAVGKRFPIELNKDGAAMHFSSSGITLIVGLSRPTLNEREALSGKNTTRAGIAVCGRTGFLVFDFGGCMDFDCPFDLGLEKHENIPLPETVTSNSRYLLTIVGVDVTDNRVFHIRIASLSPRVSRHIFEIIRRQMAEPISFQENEQLVDAAYSRYPSAKSMRNIALAFDKLGA